MMKKEYITALKKSNELPKILNPGQENSTLIFILENLGRLPSKFDGGHFIPFIEHSNDKIRLLAVKNIGKLCNDKYLHLITGVAFYDKNTMVRREAISAIGRMRSKQAIPVLISKLKDSDPKVILQAIRGLLIFKHDKTVQLELKKLAGHPNEMIQAVIEKEFSVSEKDANTGQTHPQSPDFMKNLVVQGDVSEILKYVPDESVHLTFTSPPYYNARDYSIYQSYKEYLEFLRDVFKQVHRITKEGRFFILNTSPVIIPRVSRQYASKRYPIPFDIHPLLTEMGWEFIDDIVWIKPESSVKNRNAGFLQHRKPLAYKPNIINEYVMVYRKKTHKLLDWNIRQYDRETVDQSKITGEYESSNMWYIDPTFDKVHSAVFPVELCNRIVQFYSYVGDLVFDPFGGSGTVAKAALNLRRYFFLTEIQDSYIERIKEQIRGEPLFDERIPEVKSLEDFKKAVR